MLAQVPSMHPFVISSDRSRFANFNLVVFKGSIRGMAKTQAVKVLSSAVWNLVLFLGSSKNILSKYIPVIAVTGHWQYHPLLCLNLWQVIGCSWYFGYCSL